MKIVVRAPNWIGDSVLSLPALESLRKNYPQAEIWVAAKEWVKDIFAALNFVQGVIPLPPTDDLKSLPVSVQTIKKLKFDIGLLLPNSFSSALLFYLAKIPQRWGYSSDGRGLLLTKWVSPKKQDGSVHQLSCYLDLISNLGLKTVAPKLSFPLSKKEKVDAKKLLLSLNMDLRRPLVLLHPGASYGPAKRWSVLKFSELAALLQKRKKASVIISGSNDEAQLAESIAMLMRKKPVSLAGKTSLLRLASLISNADLFITNDSGPMHLANALHVPVVAIFGPTDPALTGPYQQPSAVIKKDVPCSPCSYRECPFDHRCMENIPIEEVFQACQKFLK